MLVWSVLQARQAFFRPYTPVAFAADFLLNVGAILLATTLYAGAPLLLSGLLAGAAVFVYVVPAERGRAAEEAAAAAAAAAQAPARKEAARDLPAKPFLTTYRGCMLVITCLAILAVDFRIFPRRFGARSQGRGGHVADGRRRRVVRLLGRRGGGAAGAARAAHGRGPAGVAWRGGCWARCATRCHCWRWAWCGC